LRLQKRARAAEKNRIVRLSPVTANGWISILKVICTAMTKHYELPRDPARAIEYFPVPRTYTREQPNALAPEDVGAFLLKMQEMGPQHYAMTFLGFAIGARPSTLRPLRRRGPAADILWDESVVLLRRSNPMRQEIVDQTKTAFDQEIPLPPAVMRVLRNHADTLPPGPMADSDLLFPSIKGGMRSRSVLDKPFRRVLKALGWKVRLTPKGMRRTFQDLARKAEVHDFVVRAISGHATERMQRHYSTAQREEMRAAVGKVISLATARTDRARRARGPEPAHT
jgi:integrase